MYQGKWRLLSMALVRRWWLCRRTYRPNYVGFVRGISPVARPWHFGLCLNDYVLYSILWTFGPIRTSVEADLVLGLFFRHIGARSSYDIYLDEQHRYSLDILGTRFVALDNGARVAQPGINRRQDAFSPWERFVVYVKYMLMQYSY